MYRSRIPEISRGLRDAVEDHVVRTIASLTAESAKRRVAVESGDLLRAIHVEHTGIGEYQVIAGNHDVFYGHFVEYGTSHTAAQPFLVPALEESRAEGLRIGKAALKNL